MSCFLFSRHAYIEGKKERPPFVPPSPEEIAAAAKKKSEEKKKLPEELRCPICRELFDDAVAILCCGKTACDNCKYCVDILFIFFILILFQIHRTRQGEIAILALCTSFESIGIGLNAVVMGTWCKGSKFGSAYCGCIVCA